MKRVITSHGSHDKPGRETRFTVNETTTMVWYYNPDDPRSVTLCLKPEYVTKICSPEEGGRQVIPPAIKKAGGNYPDLILKPLENDLGFPSGILFCEEGTYPPLIFDEPYTASNGTTKFRTHLSKVVKQIEERNPGVPLEIHLALYASRFDTDEKTRIHLLGRSRRRSRKRKTRKHKHKRR